MIGQRATGLPEKVKVYGCYFLSLARLAWEFGDPERNIGLMFVRDLYQVAKMNKWMDEDCFIKKPQAIVNHISPNKLQFLGKRDADYELGNEERAIELWVLPRNTGTWRHFVYGTYDPWPLSVTRAEGELDSYRVFTRT